MHKLPQEDFLCCGMDVSAAQLVVALEEGDSGRWLQRSFPNRASGHQALIQWLQKSGIQVRVCLEATGVYSLDIALALHAASGLEIAVLNPKMVNRFAATLCRSKTDPADAQVLAEYARRMPFQSWHPPQAAALELRAITRHIAALGQQHTRQSNRLHAVSASLTGSRCVQQDLKRSLRDLVRRIEKMRCHALALIEQNADLRSRFALLLSMPGIAKISALNLLGELALLAPGLTVRQWVAHSGLDPAHHQSGTSVHPRSRISRAGNRYLRRALYMPALVAVRHDPSLRAFYQALIARHKAKLQALIAVARKILHALFGMFRWGTVYDGSRLFPSLNLALAA
ncbi:MAG TPA: IS110 family transposase [Candidatus Angelobacter sp.]|nr:IS110 family transposase [Candidatus Angelobacter sp.]